MIENDRIKISGKDMLLEWYPIYIIVMGFKNYALMGMAFTGGSSLSAIPKAFSFIFRDLGIILTSPVTHLEIFLTWMATNPIIWVIFGLIALEELVNDLKK